MFLGLSIICWLIIFFLSKDNKFYISKGFHMAGGGGKKGGEEVTVDYHWIYSAAEIKCYEKPLITFEARLGNVLYIGGVTPLTTYIPSFWLKKYFYARGYGYIKSWPYTIRLFKNSLNNELVEGVDFTYDNTIGKVVLSVGLVSGDLVAGDWCYDETNKEETSYYADFSFSEIYKRLKTFKYYKYQDDGLDTYLKCNQRTKHFLSEIHKPMVYGNYDIVFNPQVKIGNSIYINHSIPNVQRIFFIDKIRESHSKISHAVEISGISFPETYETINRYQQQVSGNRLQFTLPELTVTFIGSSQHTDGLYFSGRANKIGSTTIDVIYRSSLELKMSKSDEFKIFPGVGFTPNTKDLGILYGRIYQWYDISFSNLAASYDEFNDADVFFAQRLVNFSLYNTTDSYEIKNLATTMYIGRKEILNKGHNLAPYASGDHILFFDASGDFWLSDYRFTTKKMVAHSISATSIEMIGSYNYCFALFDTVLKRFDIDEETWSTITTLSNNYPLKQPDRKFYIDIEDNTYLYSHGNITGGVGNYNNTLDILRYKQGVVTEVNYCNQIGVADYKGGVPYIFDKWVFWGQSAWELYGGAYTHGHLPISPTGILSVYYASNYEKTVQWGVACTDRTNSLTATYGKGKKWNFFRRTSNELAFGWDNEGEITFTNDMIIIPLGSTYDGLLVYLKGLDLQSTIHPNTDCAVGIIAHNGSKIELKLAKVEGESDPIYNHSFFLNGKLYIGWKDLTNLNSYETIGEIELT